MTSLEKMVEAMATWKAGVVCFRVWFDEACRPMVGHDVDIPSDDILEHTDYRVIGGIIASYVRNRLLLGLDVPEMSLSLTDKSGRPFWNRVPIVDADLARICGGQS